MAEEKLNVVKVQSVSEARRQALQGRDKFAKTPNRLLWATIAARFPQYTLEQASKLSARDINLLLEVRKRLDAEFFLRMSEASSVANMPKKGQADYYSRLQAEYEGRQ